MLARSIALALAALLLQTLPLAATASARTRERPADAARVRAAIRGLGVGEAARVELRLADRRTVSGHVVEARDEAFSVADRATGEVVQVPYGDVAAVRGNNLSTGAKIAIGAGIAAAAIVAFILWASQFE